MNTPRGRVPIVIAHRGASGELPEHTLEAYRLAIAQGADFIEPDLVLTRDGEPIARHEPMLDDTTDVAAKFPASRRTTRDVDGVPTTAFFASDFTLAEIRTLRARQARAGRPTRFDGLYAIPTFDELVSLARSEAARTGRKVGVYPETKHPSFHDALFGRGTLEDRMLATLHSAWGDGPDAPVFIQSFEVANLRALRARTGIRLVQLVAGSAVANDGSVLLSVPHRQPYDFVLSGDPRLSSDLLTPAGLEFVKTYADAIGPWKPWLVRTVLADAADRPAQAPTRSPGAGATPYRGRRVEGGTGVIEAAHARGLLVHSWTFRDDAGFDGFPDPKAELRYYLDLGVDGVFTDFPATGVAARDRR